MFEMLTQAVMSFAKSSDLTQGVVAPAPRSSLPWFSKEQPCWPYTSQRHKEFAPELPSFMKGRGREEKH